MQIVLVNPQIPQNTGSIARTCAATKTPLHIIEPMAFEINEKNVRRAGLDYWPHVDLTVHKSWEDYVERSSSGRIWCFSKFGKQLYYKAEFSENDALVFGSETTGLGEEFLKRYKDTVVTIPMPCSEVRSLNLSNAVSIALYEARRQLALDE